MKITFNVLRAIVLYLLVSYSICLATELPDYIPESLKPWSSWVMHGKTKKIECVPHFNDSEELQCAFLSSVNFNLNDKGGEFKQEWQVYHETYIALPVTKSNWPQNVMVNREGSTTWSLAVVIQQEDIYGNIVPSVKLSQGRYRVTGNFIWQQQPEYIQLSPESALVELKMNGVEVLFPNIDDNGRLWLNSSTKNSAQKEENRLKVETFRLIDDNIPPQVTIYATLDVAGEPREVKLGPLYSPKEFIPLTLETQLPSKLESDGTIRVQAKAGRDIFTLKLRHIGTLSHLDFKPPNDGYYPKQEVWSVRHRPDLRIVEVSGVSSVDPKLTSLPEEWKSYPAYIMQPNESMKFKEIKRGDPLPPPDQLNLHRRLWLAFDGLSYTVQDRVTGNKNSGWRLEFSPLMQPGKVTIDDTEQLVTTINLSQNGYKNAGVELRRGVLNLVAESKIRTSVYAIPATGWLHSFQKVTGELNLPPGWRLIAAKGVDNISGTWIKRWSLLDIFIVLIFTIATAKLFSFPLSIVGFVTLVLLYHEPNAPRYVWLFLLLSFVLLKITEANSGRLRESVKLYQFLVVISLLLISVPYAIESLRIGIYPQLENRWVSVNDTMQLTSLAPMNSQLMDKVDSAMVQPEAQIKGKIGGSTYFRSEEGSKLLRVQNDEQHYGQDHNQRSKVMQYDPKSITQTGPGLPLWHPFRTIQFSWSGPVEKEQTIFFALIGPTVNLILAFVRVTLIIILAIGMFRTAGFLQLKERVKNINMLTLLVIAVSILTISTPYRAIAGEIPSPEILEELQKRLLEKDRCFPFCADISQMEISIKYEELEINLNVDAAIDTVIPLPGHANHWIAEQVSINGKDADALFRYNQTIWAMVPKGKSVVVVQGRVGSQNSFQIPFLLKPHSGKIIQANGWEIQGIEPDSSLDDQLQFKRIIVKSISTQSEQEKEILETGLLPPFVLVQRTLLLGLDWKVETRIDRLTPAGSAITLNLPLLDGESVITEGIRVKNSIAYITLNAAQNSLFFESFLELSDKIRLYHALSSENNHTQKSYSTNRQNEKREVDTIEAQNLEWTEVWQLDASPIFHIETEGIPVILHQNNQKRWYPTWHPLPGEEVILRISRPKGIEGKTMTIEKSNLELYPGHTTTRAILKLFINSSKGGQHTITIPEKAVLEEVKINGEVQLIRQEGEKVVLPITPGNQNVEFIWKDDREIATFYQTPKIDLGTDSVNASVDLHISSDRWTLFVGGEQLMAPAILFWSKIIVVLLISVGLSITKLTPLKFYQWFLLGIGMSMSSTLSSIFVVAWLIVLDMRKKWGEGIGASKFNLIQLGIVGLTVIAVMSLLFAISQGLLGHPSMNITGNGSSETLLKWYHDISDSTLPVAWFFSLPMFAYRIAMLLWALWLSFWLISILKWGWGNFATPVIWIASKKSDSNASINCYKEVISQKDESEKRTEAEPAKKPKGWCRSIKKIFGVR